VNLNCTAYREGIASCARHDPRLSSECPPCLPYLGTGKMDPRRIRDLADELSKETVEE